MRKRKARRKRRGRYHTGIHVSAKAPGPCHYRSGWELAYLQHLDADPCVLAYAYEPFKLLYVSNIRSGRTRGYLPDMLVVRVDGTRSLVEVKPARKVTHPTVQKKLAAAREWCNAHGVTLEVITEHELRVLGLLK